MSSGADYDRQTIAIMERSLRSDSGCVDVGCHSGSILGEIVRIAPNGHHYAFEPLPCIFDELRQRFARLPNVELFNLALSDSPGPASFQHVVTNPGYSGLRRRRYDRPNERVVEITVEKATLDDLVPASRRVDFLKVDVEGAELEVLRGAIRTIQRNRPFIVFEHGLGGSDFYGTTPQAVYELINGDCGMSISRMESWLDRGATLSRAQFVQQFETCENFYFLAHP
jgi:FkbM family methyltransferase